MPAALAAGSDCSHAIIIICGDLSDGTASISMVRQSQLWQDIVNIPMPVHVV